VDPQAQQRTMRLSIAIAVNFIVVFGTLIVVLVATRSFGWALVGLGVAFVTVTTITRDRHVEGRWQCRVPAGGPSDHRSIRPDVPSHPTRQRAVTGRVGNPRGN
jgi:hypothetical protein